MKVNVLEILLCHGEYIARISEEHVSSVSVFRHVLLFPLFEGS